MILKDSLLLTLVGVVIGVPLAMMVGKELTSSLYGVKAFDVLSYVAGCDWCGYCCAGELVLFRRDGRLVSIR